MKSEWILVLSFQNLWVPEPIVQELMGSQEQIESMLTEPLHYENLNMKKIFNYE